MSENLSPAELGERDKKPHRRPLFYLSGLVLVLLGVLTFLYLRDDAPADDSDFLPDWSEGSALTNPLVTFLKEIQPANPEHQDPEIWRRQQALTEELLTKKASVLAAFRKLMATDAASWRLLDVKTAVFEETSIAPLFRIGSDVLPKNIEDHVLKGESQEAVTLSLEMHHFAHGLLKAEVGLYGYNTAMNVQEIAGELLLKALEGTASPDLLKQAQEQLSGRDPTPQDLVLALKDEHANQKTYLLEYVNETGIFEGVFPNEDPRFIKRWYRPHRTINQHLELCRQIVAGLDQGWAGAQSKADAWSEAVQKRALRGKWTRYVNPNFAGDMILLHKAPWRLARDTAIHITIQRMLMTSLAIRRYELMHHMSPRTLEELVPAFLATVPVDAMNRAPLEWDTTSRTLRASGHRMPDLSRDSTPQVLLDFPLRLGGKVTLGEDAKIHFQLGLGPIGEKSGNTDTPSPR